MSEKQKMCTVMDLPTSILASLFAALMFTGIHNQFPLLTMVYMNTAEKKHQFNLKAKIQTPNIFKI